MLGLLSVLLAGCDNDPGSVPGTDVVRVLDRASLALRGIHPSDADVERVVADPSALREVIHGWTTDPLFGETVRDLHAEDIHVRWGVMDHGPSVGLLEPFDGAEILDSLDEAPLRFIEHVVMTGRPYTDIVTTDETMVDEIVSLAYGLDYDASGPDWQVARWKDGRPPGGLLVDNGWLLRYQVSPSNFHRSRAAPAAAALVCDDFGRREGLALDIPSGTAGVEGAECQACHRTMDPISAAFWPARGFILARETQGAEQAGCPDNLAYACYPLQMWDDTRDPTDELDPADAAWYGTPVTDLGDLGQKIADDPRFASCAAQRFWGFLANVERDDIPFEVRAELTERFVAGGYDARELMIDVVTHPAFTDLVSTRPSQYARFVEHVTGYRWTGTPDPVGCQGDCVGEIDLARNDHFGMHTIMGGPDGWFILEGTPTPTPTGQLARQWLAEEAAAYVVGIDVAAPAEERRLLTAADPWDLSDAAIDAQLAALQRRILGPTTDEAATGPLRDLFDGAVERHDGDPLAAWRLVVAALLLDPEAVAF